MSASDARLRFSALDIPAMASLAAALAKECRRGDCLKLRGELGAGKTSFARSFIHALSAQAEEVVSPTFTLVQTYPASPATIWHFDLYRLKTPQEAVELGLDEALEEGICLIEWPQIIENTLPSDALDVSIAIGDNGFARSVTLTGNAAWQDRLNRLKER